MTENRTLSTGSSLVAIKPLTNQTLLTLRSDAAAPALLHVLVNRRHAQLSSQSSSSLVRLGKVKQMNGPPLATKVDQLGKVGNVWPLQIVGPRRDGLQ